MKTFFEHPVWSSPFRPFFLFAPLMAILSPVLWIFELSGVIELETVFSSTLVWHAHELLFGFSFAIICGFLLTASSHWSGKKPLIGEGLSALFILWLLSRLSVFIIETKIPMIACNIGLDLIFNVVFYKMVEKNRNKKILIPLTILYMISHILFLYGDMIGSDFYYSWGRDLSIVAILWIIVIMSSRLVPMFTRGRLGVALKQYPVFLERIPYFVIPVMGIPREFMPSWFGGIFLLTGFLFFYKQIYWKAWSAFKEPMLAILHTGSFFVGLYFISFGLELFGVVNSLMTIHIFTLGVLGIFCLGMMIRVSKGHTGRQILSHKFDRFMMICLVLATLIRTILLEIFPSFHVHFLHTGLMFWILAHVTYLTFYSLILVSPRLTLS